MKDLERGRESFGRRAWDEAYRSFSRAEETAPLGGDDLDRMAMSAALTGRDDQGLAALERAYQAHTGARETAGAARAAFWLGFALMNRGETGQATGWVGRAQRLLSREGLDCAERGYLLLPAARQHLAGGDDQAAFDASAEAAAIGERFGDTDLVSLARHIQGRALLRQGRIEEGIALLDEAMIAVTAGEVSPFVTGLIYCSVITGCQQVYALDRAREWTSALDGWCREQPELVNFTGACLVHRAEIMQWNGEWADAIGEARRAAQRLSEGWDPKSAAGAIYQEAEVHRLRGEFGDAEDAYRRAGHWGWDPQPGLALLRLAQGRTDTAAVQIRRAIAAAAEDLKRTSLLPACVEIMLAAGDVEEARRAAEDLEEVAARFHSDALAAMAAHARGALDLAEDDARSALPRLRRAYGVWRRLGAPYLAARVRVLAGRACRALGDGDGARSELDGAREVFTGLGAAPDLSALDALEKAAAPDRPYGLTARELQVLRLVAAGKTNRGIATELYLSEKTVDRHVSNIFSKLDVASRSAATAFAYEHNLL